MKPEQRSIGQRVADIWIEPFSDSPTGILDANKRLAELIDRLIEEEKRDLRRSRSWLIPAIRKFIHHIQIRLAGCTCCTCRQCSSDGSLGISWITYPRKWRRQLKYETSTKINRLLQKGRNKPRMPGSHAAYVVGWTNDRNARTPAKCIRKNIIPRKM